MMSASPIVLLRIRPAMPDPEDRIAARGPLMMESVLATLHALKGADAVVGLEFGFSEGKVTLYARGPARAAPLLESQLYAQYPDAEIDVVDGDPFAVRAGEIVLSSELVLSDPEVFPIKRHPQFVDIASRQFVDTIAAVTSALARYGVPGMRGHVQIVLQPIGGRFRRRALKFLPLLGGGLSKHFPWYAKLFTHTHLVRGWRRAALLPIDILLGGFRAWFVRVPTHVSLLSGEEREDEEQGSVEGKVTARTHEREDKVAAAVDKINRLLFLSNVRVSVIAPAAARAAAEAKVQEISSSFHQFSLPQCNGFRALAPRDLPQIPSGFTRPGFLLSAEEIATLWHVPNVLVKTPNLDWVVSRKLEPPVNLPVVPSTPLRQVQGNTEQVPAPEDLTTLGEAVFHGTRQCFGIRPDDRRRHIYIIGKTGMGKSTLLENMVASDVLRDSGIGVIDPHGDLIEAILRIIPKHRQNEVVLFDPSDRDHPISFNILECPNAWERPVVTSGLMSVFTKLWPDAFSGRMEHILRNTLLALLENEGTTMLGILRMFGDDAYRSKIVSHVSDPVVRSFWETEYAGWSDKYRTEAVAAIQNKIGQLVATPLIRNIVGQVHSTLDIRHAMDSGKIVLVNLSKGKLGEDTSAFLGSMLVTKFQIDAMSRADIPEAERKDFYLYVDEFQNFATPSFASILSEARKYRLCLTMANQYVAQLLFGERGNTQLKDAVFGNVGTLISFQVGSEDAEELSMQFEEMATPNDILSLPKYHAYVRLMIDGVPSKPFSVSTLPPPPRQPDDRRVEAIRRLSRERYSEKREVIEEKIRRWAASASEARTQVKQAQKAQEKAEEERKKAKAKGMSLEEYRKWRDRELWTNTFNALRKRALLGEALTPEEQAQMKELEGKLKASGGVPPTSKTLLDAQRKGIEGKCGDKA